MLKSKFYAEILEDFIIKLSHQLNCDVRYKIYIQLDFSLVAKVFIDFPENAWQEFPLHEESENLQIKFSRYVKDYFDRYPENALYDNNANLFIPEVRFDIEELQAATNSVNRSILAGEPIEFGAKYRLSSLIDVPVGRESSSAWGDTPIITFYSYKGGMGRTTTLIAYALYLAAKGKKVAIVDCDLEAPGYLNFFNLSSQQDLMKGRRNGLVEYLCDYTFADYQDEYIDLSNYIVIPESISQGGLERDYMSNIVIVPGGNLNDVNENIYMERRDKERLSKSGMDYIEGLSRLNISNPFVTRDGLSSLFAKLSSERNIDVILVDSRTGFNDIFGTIALSMSDHVIGFVGFSDQTIPGLRQLYRCYTNTKASFRLDLVTNLVPQSVSEEWLERGRNRLYEIWQTESEGSDKDTPGHYVLRRMPMLEMLGTGDDNADARLVTIVEDIINEERRRDASLEIGEMGALFEHMTVSSRIFSDSDMPEEEVMETSSESDLNIEASISAESLNEKSSFQRQKAILRYTKRKFANIHVFAEDTNIENSMFFYRKCMAAFFNPSKFIILGSKGSGKSMLYRALGTPDYVSTARFIVNCAKKTVSRDHCNFDIPDSEDIICLNTISLRKGDFDFNLLLDKLPISKLKLFWMIYTWNAILTDSRFVSDPEFRTIVLEESLISYCLVASDLDGYQQAGLFETLVEKDFQFLGNVERDFRLINSYLEKKGKRLFILYDGLDYINPRTWSRNISPLVDFWRDRTSKYSHIAPKLFIRTDLFAYIEGTNTLRLKEVSINIDWSLEEVFGYFFKIVLSDNSIKQHFWEILSLLDKETHIRTIQNCWDDEAEQFLDPNPATLMPLVKIYFGEKVAEARNWSSWEFFKRTLSNANNGISLRPFINLLNREVIDAAIQDSNRHVQAILPSKYYATQENRDKAANDNFEDMAKGDDFTADILKFREFLTSSKGDKYRFKELDDVDFEALLSDIITEYGPDNLISRNKADLCNQLIAAGIVAVVPRGRKYYRFASMYWYTWGLANAENWEKGTLAYGRRGHFVVITQDGRRISFRSYNEPKDLRVGDRIEYKLLLDSPGNFKVDQWRPASRRR